MCSWWVAAPFWRLPLFVDVSSSILAPFRSVLRSLRPASPPVPSSTRLKSTGRLQERVCCLSRTATPLSSSLVADQSALAGAGHTACRRCHHRSERPGDRRCCHNQLAAMPCAAPSCMAAAACSSSSRASAIAGRPLASPTAPRRLRPQRRQLQHVAATAAPSRSSSSSSSSRGSSPQELEVADYSGDAFAELVAMAVAADPSLEPPPQAASMAAAYSSAGPPPAALPLSNKPGWLRQRAAQGQRFDYLKEQMGGLKLATVGGAGGWSWGWLADWVGQH